MQLLPTYTSGTSSLCVERMEASLAVLPRPTILGWNLSVCRSVACLGLEAFFFFWSSFFPLPVFLSVLFFHGSFAHPSSFLRPRTAGSIAVRRVRIPVHTTPSPSSILYYIPTPFSCLCSLLRTSLRSLLLLLLYHPSSLWDRRSADQQAPAHFAPLPRHVHVHFPNCPVRAQPSAGQLLLLST